MVIFVFPFVGNFSYVDKVVVVVVEVGELPTVVASVVLSRHVAGMIKGYLRSSVIIV